MSTASTIGRLNNAFGQVQSSLAPAHGAGASSALTIEELGVQNPRKLTLLGSGLPHRGAEWGGSCAVTTTWYNGNGVATQQVLGPREEPSSWTGTWKRTMLARSPAKWLDESGVESLVVQPRILRDAMDALRIGGALLRVTWSSDGTLDTLTHDKIVREGRLVSFHIQVDTVYDITWTAKFDWMGRGGPKVVPISTRDDSAAAAAADFQVQQSLLDTAARATFLTSRMNIEHSADVFTLGQLEAFVNTPLKVVNGLQQSLRQTTTTFNRFLNIVNAIVKTPFDTVKAITALARQAMKSCDTFSTTLGNFPRELLSNRTSAASILRAHAYYVRVDDAVIKTSRAAAAMALRFTQERTRAGRSRINTTNALAVRDADILIIHKCKADDSPMRLSVKYYGSPDYAWFICRANGLPWTQTTLPKGALLTIPTLSSTAQRSGG